MITHRHIKNGLVALWETGEKDGEAFTRKVSLAPVDAAHALQVDPDHWSLVDPDNPDAQPGIPAIEPEPEAEIIPEGDE